MLKQFGALPTEKRARDMKDGDYLWCLVHTLLDREEELDRLCPACRAQVRQHCCPSCGAPMETVQSWENPTFDEKRFQALKRGDRP